MKTDSPAPLVSEDLNLRDVPLLHMDVAWLRDSRLAARSTGDEFMIWILLACASWHQRSAGSLPMDEIEVAWFAGYGRAVDEWLKVRHGRSMDGYVVPTAGSTTGLSWRGCWRFRRRKYRVLNTGAVV